MPETLDPCAHVKPFVYATAHGKALHFSISEIQSRMSLQDPYALDLEYTRTIMGFLLFHPDPRRVVMVGLGGGSLAKFCHRYLPSAHIDVVEINPHVIALRDDFQVPADDERFRVIPGDGARYVREGDTPCDVLIVDGFDSDGLPGPLCSQRFYDDACAMLEPQGVLVANLHDDHAHHTLHLERIRRSFGGSVLVVRQEDSTNRIVFACKGDALDRPRAGMARVPQGLDKAGAPQLMAAFARVSTAWKEERG
jgi:spermidine synthase